MSAIRTIIRIATLTASAVALFFASPAWAQSDHPHANLWVEGRSDKQAREPIRLSTFSQLAEGISPAVVNVLVEYEGAEGLEGFLEGGGWPNGRTGQGSGFIIHPSGLILTNHHVVAGAETIKVKLLDNRELEARVVGVDEQTDVALMKIEGARFPAVTLGDSDEVHVGEHVLAIGNPLGLSHTVTSGIVSALGRRNLAPSGKEIYADFIQTDASINPGNSGGPLISLKGEVIGINTAVNRQGQGIGFAIPINMVKALIPQLHQRGFVVRTWLGIRIQEVTPALAKSFGLREASGALVTEIVDDSPAEKAGLVSGDIVLTFNERKIESSDQLPWLVSTSGTQDDVVLDVLRNSSKTKIRVRMEELPNQRQNSAPSQPKTEAPKSDKRELGVAVKELGKTLARQLGANGTEGVVVTEISDNSPARASGLRRRDVIKEVGKVSIKGPSDYASAISKFSIGDVVRLKVIRGGRVVFVAFER